MRQMHSHVRDLQVNVTLTGSISVCWFNNITIATSLLTTTTSYKVKYRWRQSIMKNDFKKRLEQQLEDCHWGTFNNRTAVLQPSTHVQQNKCCKTTAPLQNSLQDDVQSICQLLSLSPAWCNAWHNRCDAATINYYANIGASFWTLLFYFTSAFILFYFYMCRRVYRRPLMMRFECQSTRSCDRWPRPRRPNGPCWYAGAVCK